MLRDIVKMLELFNHYKSLKAEVDGWTIELGEFVYNGKREFTFSRDLPEETVEELEENVELAVTEEVENDLPFQ